MALEVLYLVRHGKAEGSHPQGDRHRALSAEGRARIDVMLPRALALSLGCDLAVSSPYLRAVQTRDLFAPAFSPTRTETSTALTPEADPNEAFEELLSWEAQGHARIALYTHNPFVTALAGLVARPSGPEHVFHTPTILALRFEHGLKLRSGRPLWTLNP